MPLLSRLRRSRRFHLLVSPPPVSSLNEVVVAVESGREDKTLIGCVLGSAGPIWFVVNEEELVATVIDTALKAYAREGRLPVQKL